MFGCLDAVLLEEKAHVLVIFVSRVLSPVFYLYLQNPWLLNKWHRGEDEPKLDFKVDRTAVLENMISFPVKLFPIF